MKGDNIKKFREKRGAKISITDGCCPERIVTAAVCSDSVLKEFFLNERIFQED